LLIYSAVDHLEFTNTTRRCTKTFIKQKVVPLQERFQSDMLTSIGVNTVILGHSERRAYFHESDAFSNKVDTALKHDMTVISVWVKN
jgi:triosephosphate isomerase